MTEQKRTEFAMAAIDFAELFNSFFREQSVVGYRVQLTAPEGQSTGGGVQARQHVTLIDDAGGKTVVVGACNTVDKTAELRMYDQVAKRFQQRYEGTPFPVPRGQYEGLFQRCREFFANQGVAVSIAPAEPSDAIPQAPHKKSAAGLIIAVAVVSLLVAAGLIYLFLLHPS